jgi:membrane protein YdbS with pleckstrin-like domain
MLPRKFLNQDEELLAELRPHWIFLFGPLFTSLGTWAVIIVIVILWHNAPSWTNYPLLILAVIPGLWLLGRYVRWRSYIIALTSTRILVRQGIFGRDTVQLRLQRIVEVNLRQALIERVLQCGSLLIDVQGEDNTLTLEYVRKPAVVQRVINSQINEIVGGGEREPIPEDMLPLDQRSRARARQEDTEEMDAIARRPSARPRSRPMTPSRTALISTPPIRAPIRSSLRRPPPGRHHPRRRRRHRRHQRLTPPSPAVTSTSGTGSFSSTICASAASSPRRSSPPRRPNCSTASDSQRLIGAFVLRSRPGMLARNSVSQYGALVTTSRRGPQPGAV